MFCLLAPLSEGAAACNGVRRCETGNTGRWAPSGQVRWTLDYSRALLDGRLDASRYDVFVLPLSIVEEAAQRAQSEPRNNPVDDLTCRHNKRLVCYTNCGAWEAGHWNETLLAPNRAALLGKSMQNYPDEKWLNITRVDLLRPLVRDKFAAAAKLGCDALVCDNTEAWITGTDGDGGNTIALFREHGLEAVKKLAQANVEAQTGHAISYQDQIRYNTMLAEEAHAQCLSIGLLNDVFQIHELHGAFDFALNEQCHHCGWCDLYKPFTSANKTVLHLEFQDNEGFCAKGSTPIQRICRDVASQGLSSFSTIKRIASSKLHNGDQPEVCPPVAD